MYPATTGNKTTVNKTNDKTPREIIPEAFYCDFMRFLLSADPLMAARIEMDFLV